MVLLLLLQTLGMFVFCELLGSQLSVGLYFVIAIVGSRLGCSCCWGVPVEIGGKDVVFSTLLIADISTLLLMIKDC